MLKSVICFETKEKVRVIGGGDSLDMSLFAIAICKIAAEKISIEKNVNYTRAMEIVLNNIKENHEKIKKAGVKKKTKIASMLRIRKQKQRMKQEIL